MAGDDAELERGHFDAVDDREVLLRLQNNIKSRAVRGGDYARAHEIVRRMLLFAPDHVPLWRDASVTSFQVGQVQRAVKLAEAYFERAPDSAHPQRRGAAAAATSSATSTKAGVAAMACVASGRPRR